MSNGNKLFKVSQKKINTENKKLERTSTGVVLCMLPHTNFSFVFYVYFFFLLKMNLFLHNHAIFTEKSAHFFQVMQVKTSEKILRKSTKYYDFVRNYM
jgi:hypothetical protein